MKGIGKIIPACLLITFLFLMSAPLLADPSYSTGKSGTTYYAGFIEGFTEGFSRGIGIATSPELTSISPQQVSEAIPFTLELKGSGFVSESLVFVQVQAKEAGQLTWLSFTPVIVDDKTLRVTFEKGFSATPSQRKIYVQNPKEKKSKELTLSVVKGSTGQPSVNNAGIGQTAGNTQTGGSLGQPSANSNTTSPSSDGIFLQSLNPAEVKAETPLLLSVSGKGFTRQTKVYIEVNKNAGKKNESGEELEPKCDFVSFMPVFINEGEIQLKFDKGFAANPARRKIYVEDSEGRISNKLELIINP